MAVYTDKCKICGTATPIDKVADKLAICPNCGASYFKRGSGEVKITTSDQYIDPLYKEFNIVTNK